MTCSCDDTADRELQDSDATGLREPPLRDSMMSKAWANSTAREREGGLVDASTSAASSAPDDGQTNARLRSPPASGPASRPLPCRCRQSALADDGLWHLSTEPAGRPVAFDQNSGHKSRATAQRDVSFSMEWRPSEFREHTLAEGNGELRTRSLVACSTSGLTPKVHHLHP